MMLDFINKNETKLLIIIVSLSFLLSLAYSFYFKITPIADAGAYDRIGYNLAQGYGYKGDPNEADIESGVLRRSGPGYEYFLAGVYLIFGHRHEPVWVIQALLLGLSAFLVYLIAKKIFTKLDIDSQSAALIGLIAAVLVGFSPDLITVSGMLLTENLSIFLLLLSIFFFFNYFEKPGWLYLIGSAVFLAFALLTRSILGLVIIPFLIGIWPRSKIQSVAFLAIIVLLFTPWTIRNYKIYHKFIPTTVTLGMQLYTGNFHGATGELDTAAQPQLNLPAHLNPVEEAEGRTKLAVQFILNNPLEYLQLTFFRTNIFFSFSRPTGWWDHLVGLAKILTLITSAVYSVIIFTFGIFGLWQAFIKMKIKGWRNHVNLLILMTLAVPLPLVFVIIESRYRFPIYPFLAIFTGWSVAYLLTKQLKLKPLLITFLILSLNAFFDVARNFERIIERLRSL